MDKETDSLNASNDNCLPLLPDSHSTVELLHEPFLNFDPNSELSFEDKSAVYNSLIALVKTDYQFDNALQDRAVRFLRILSPKWDEPRVAAKLVTDLVPSAGGSTSGFIESILTLLSSPNSTVVAAVLSFLYETARLISATIQCHLVKSNLIANVLATVQPQTLPISGNEEIFSNLIWSITECINLLSTSNHSKLGITTTVEKYKHREMVFHEVVLPSSQFVTFLISNRYVLNESLLEYFRTLLCKILEICPFHRPTLEFVLASPIAMAFSSCLLFTENVSCHCDILTKINRSLESWKTHRPMWLNLGNG